MHALLMHIFVGLAFGLPLLILICGLERKNDQSNAGPFSRLRACRGLYFYLVCGLEGFLINPSPYLARISFELL